MIDTIPSASRVYYSPFDHMVYQSPIHRNLQKILGRVSLLYKDTAQVLDVPPPERSLISHSVSNWHHNFLWWNWTPYPHPSGGNPGRGNLSGNLNGKIGNDECKACLVVIVITLMVSALISFGIAAYKTHQEHQTAQTAKHLKQEICHLLGEVRRDLNSTGAKNFETIYENLQLIETCLRKEIRYRNINTVFGALGTTAIGLLVATLVGYLLNLYDIPTNMPLDLLNISGSTAIAVSLLGLALNSCFKDRLNHTRFHEAWASILEFATSPSQTIQDIEALYTVWTANSSGKFYIETFSQYSNRYYYWTLEPDTQQGYGDIILHLHQSDQPLDLKEYGYLPAVQHL